MQKDNTVRYNGTELRICEYNIRVLCKLPAFTFDGMKERTCYNNDNNNNNNLTIEIQRMWNVKTKVIPVIIRVTGTISNSFIKYVSNIPGKH